MFYYFLPLLVKLLKIMHIFSSKHLKIFQQLSFLFISIIMNFLHLFYYFMVILLNLVF